MGTAIIVDIDIYIYKLFTEKRREENQLFSISTQ